MGRLPGIKKTLIIVIAFFCCLAVLHLFSSFATVLVNSDAGYYLSISREVMDGATPTVNVTTSYPPLFYYLFAIWFKLVGTEYSRALLLIYLVHVINCFLLYLVLNSFVKERLLRVVLCFSYFYSTMLLEGYYIELEPFQILFALLAYLVYLKNLSLLMKHAIVGFFLGCSIMVKQYSLFLFFGFLVSFWYDLREKENSPSISWRMLVTAVFFLLPLTLFVVLTDATLKESLYSFAFYRGSAMIYATHGAFDPFGRIKDVLIRIGQMNWLFIPFLLYASRALFQNDTVRRENTVKPIFLCSLLPLMIRQYGHYFQLIAPWSFILLGVASESAIKQIILKEKRFAHVAVALALSFFLILIAFIVITPSFASLSKISIAAATFLFLSSIFFAFCLGFRISHVRITSQVAPIIICAIVFFETLFLSLKLPLNYFEQLKKNQVKEAAEINRVFPRGSSVYVLDYPELYITCDFRNPLHDYDFGLVHLDTDIGGKVDTVIVKTNSRLISSERLRKLGYHEILAPSVSAVALYAKDIEYRGNKVNRGSPI